MERPCAARVPRWPQTLSLRVDSRARQPSPSLSRLSPSLPSCLTHYLLVSLPFALFLPCWRFIVVPRLSLFHRQRSCFVPHPLSPFHASFLPLPTVPKPLSLSFVPCFFHTRARLERQARDMALLNKRSREDALRTASAPSSFLQQRAGKGQR